MAKEKVKEDEDEKVDKKAAKKGKETEDGEEGEGGDESAPSGKKKKIIIIAAAAVVLLAAAGAGLYFSGMIGGKAKEEAKTEGEEAAAAEGEHGEAPAEEAAAEGEHGEAPTEGEGKEGEGKAKEKAGIRKAPGGGVYYERVPQFRVNLNTGGRQARYLIMTVALELESSKDVSTVDINIPRINDNFQTYLRDLRTSDLEGSVGLYRLKEELMVRINNIIAPAKVKDILFREFIIQ